MKRYSSKDQERNFEPRRVRVAPARDRGLYSYRGRIRYWTVFVQDMLAHKHERKRSYPTKAQALNAAKALAQQFDLAFDLQHDVLADEEEIKRGPLRKCVACQHTQERRHVEFVCETCKAKIRRDPDDTLNAYSIDDHVLPYKRYHITEAPIRTALLDILYRLTANVDPISTFRWADERSESYFNTPKLEHLASYGKGKHSGCKVLHLREEQAQAIRDLVQEGGVLDELMTACFQAGKRKGSNMLDKLARGEINATRFQLERENDG